MMYIIVWEHRIYMKKMFKGENIRLCDTIRNNIDIVTNESDIRILTEE